MFAPKVRTYVFTVILLSSLALLSACSKATSASVHAPVAAPDGPPAAAAHAVADDAPPASLLRDVTSVPSETPHARPGLATHWGETRWSSVRETSFFRANPDVPSAVGSLFYNDHEGAKAMANAAGFHRHDTAMIGLAAGNVTVSLRDSHGHTLPAYSAGGRIYAIGEPNERYSIVVANHTPVRIEAVISVDGLDVIDGRPASFDKRGYVVNAHATLEVEGFRTSEHEVAAFRFGGVRGSYADAKGDAHNVGVIGIAVFHERGTSSWPWVPSEVDRRRNANPFPGRFAAPP